LDKQAVRKDLERILDARRVLMEPEDLVSFRNDAYPYRAQPDAAVMVTTVEEIQNLVRYAEKHEIPLVPRAAATDLAGACAPVTGGIVVDLKLMDKILEIDKGNLTATVECGVVNMTLRQAVEAIGLYYPPDPASYTVSTLGGNVATRAGGPGCVKYGTTEDYLRGLEAVVGGGEVISSGGKTAKYSSGYDLHHLFAGSEGTLGFITKCTFKLIPKPETKKTMLAIFKTIDDAANAVSAIIARGITPVTLELIDIVTAQCVEAWKPCGLPTDKDGILLIEVDGDAERVEKEAKQIEEVCKEMGAESFETAQTQAEAETLMAGRRSAFAAFAQQYPTVVVEDITVPRTMIPEVVRRCRESLEKYQLVGTVMGHAGDGNMHPNIMCDINNHEEMVRVEACLAEMAKHGLELGGTVSGEHGIGIAKSRYFPWEHSESTRRIMMGIKDVFDPKGIFNPTKIFVEGGELV
jgi:glycolate oxidase